MKKTTASILLLCSFMLPAAAADDTAAFGLSWGMTAQEVRSFGVKLKKTSDEYGVEGYKTSDVPHSLEIAEEYLLSFDDEEGLYQVSMSSKLFSNDPSGAAGKAAYGQLKWALTRKYGQPIKVSEEIDSTEGSGFYGCLSDIQCGSWSSFFRSETGTEIGLHLYGNGMGNGFVYLGYSSHKWHGIIDRFIERESGIDSGAL